MALLLSRIAHLRNGVKKVPQGWRYARVAECFQKDADDAGQDARAPVSIGLLDSLQDLKHASSGKQECKLAALELSMASRRLALL